MAKIKEEVTTYQANKAPPLAPAPVRRVNKIVMEDFDGKETQFNYGPGMSGQVYTTNNGDLCINTVDMATGQYLNGEGFRDWNYFKFETTTN